LLIETISRCSHEIAYIFGQLSSPYSIPSLLYVMRDSAEDDMVRHEAAEALGGIASEGDEGVEGELYENEEDKQKGVLGILREWSTLESAPPVVRESCQVALDMYEVSRRPPASLRSMAPCSDTDMESVAIV
jgi:deoxyhypusine monooxygenase